MSMMSIFWLVIILAFIVYMVYHDRKTKNTNEYREAVKNKTKPPKKLLYKRWWSWVLIVLLLFLSLGANDTNDDTDTADKTAKTEHTKKHAKTKKVVKTQPKKSSQPKETNTAKAVTLGAGKYKVGRDIKPGRYLIKANSGSGNLTNSDGSINIILGTEANDTGQVTSYTVTLPEGDKIKIDGIESTSFLPVKKYKYLTSLTAGFWAVGRDIKPGRYIIKAASGNGNLISNNAADDDNINTILSTSPDSDIGEVSKITVDLTNGEVIQTELERINLIKNN